MNHEALKDQWWYGFAVGIFTGIILMSFSGCVLDNIIDPRGSTYLTQEEIVSEKPDVI